MKIILSIGNDEEPKKLMERTSGAYWKLSDSKVFNQFSINLEKPYKIKVLILYKTPIFLFSSKEKV
jgi:hypothetical protein